MGNYSDVDRMIILNKLEESELSNHLNPPPSPPLTTVFYPDDQISAYHHILASTTPLSPKKRRISTNETFLTSLLENKSINDDAVPTAAVNAYPSNHKRRYSKVYRDHMMEMTVKPTIAEHTEFPQQRMFFPTFDDYDDDFVDVSYPKANNIQDILNQSTNDDEMENVGGSDGGVGDMINDLILPSMPFSRTMKVEGIYRREKMKRDQLSTMETAIQTTQLHTPLTPLSPMSRTTHNKNVQHKFDPFLKFKPSSPSDVNLLAASNMMKLKSYTHHKPRPLTTPAITINKYNPDGDYFSAGGGSKSDPNVIYNQIISANHNARHEKPMQNNNKPFSLMLDVYPMPDDVESSQPQLMQLSSTRIAPFGSPANRRPPIYPVNSPHAINNNLQYNKDSTMYNPFKYPQLQPYPYNRSPYALNPTAKEGYMRNYALQRMNTQAFGSLPAASSSSHRTISSGDEMPSQITVHLNLYPDRKKTRNVEIVNTGVAAAAADRDFTTPTTLTASSPINEHPHTLWKRLERPINNTVTKLVDSMRIGRFQSIEPFIPPFSAIKINSFQQDFDDMNESASTLLPVKQLTTDKAFDFDLKTFDSKKLMPSDSTKAAKRSYISPMANSITSITIKPPPSSPSSSSSLSSDNDITSMPISMDSMASTMSNQFATTMPSSTTATATFYTTLINQIPFISTNTPSSIQATTTITEPTMTSTVTDDLNESKLDQTTTNFYDII